MGILLKRPLLRTRRRLMHFFFILAAIIVYAHAYHRAPCKKLAVKYQFQFSECYAPHINQDLYLNEASFVMAHNAATGYIKTHNAKSNNNDTENEYYDLSSSAGNLAEYWHGYYNNGDNDGNDVNYEYYENYKSSKVSSEMISRYGKTQVGTVYDQLNDGARALDLRPKIYNNGTVGFHHGTSIGIPLHYVTMEDLLEDAKQWCNDNPKELVIIFHHELTHEAGYNGLSSQVYTEIDDFYKADDDGVVVDADDDGDNNNDNENYDDDQQQQSSYSYYYSGIAKLKEVYRELDIPYYPCDVLAGKTVGETMELADLSKLGGKGYLLAIDRQDMYASFCGKANWVSEELVTCNSISNDDERDEHSRQPYQMCTNRKNTGMSKLSNLQEYVLASANNDATNDPYELGPPADDSYYPFNLIQGYWQVDSKSVQIGVTQAASSLLEDNKRSNVNAEMVALAYKQQLKQINLFSMDNVALNGNAMFSVLRNACGQSVVKDDDDYFTCGQNLVMPHMNVSQRIPLFWNIVLFVVYSSLFIMVSVMLYKAFRTTKQEDYLLDCGGVYT